MQLELEDMGWRGPSSTPHLIFWVCVAGNLILEAALIFASMHMTREEIDMLREYSPA